MSQLDARREELREGYAANITAARADRDGKDGHVKQRRCNRCQHGLHANLQKPAHFLLVQGPQTQGIEKTELLGLWKIC